MYKSRTIFLHPVKESGNIDEFDKEDSFDRIFPNQDYLSGKRLGNLIALPLQGASVKLANGIFFDPENKLGLTPQSLDRDRLQILFFCQRAFSEKYHLVFLVQ